METTTKIQQDRLAADQGDADAQARLGLAYYLGEGVKQDWAEAARLYRLAADQGAAYPQFFLGFMYADGVGVPKDFVSAYMWYNLSAAHDGNEAAIESREQVARLMTADQIAEAQMLARDWRPKRRRYAINFLGRLRLWSHP